MDTVQAGGRAGGREIAMGRRLRWRVVIERAFVRGGRSFRAFGAFGVFRAFGGVVLRAYAGGEGEGAQQRSTSRAPWTCGL